MTQEVPVFELRRLPGIVWGAVVSWMLTGAVSFAPADEPVQPTFTAEEIKEELSKKRIRICNFIKRWIER